MNPSIAQISSSDVVSLSLDTDTLEALSAAIDSARESACAAIVHAENDAP